MINKLTRRGILHVTVYLLLGCFPIYAMANPIDDMKQQQQSDMRTIKGTVTDQTGQPLPGVSITLKGSQQGTASDLNGDYSLSIIKATNQTLVFSFIGMQTVEVKLGAKNEVNVVMTDDAKMLNEVVVTGYQTISKERATGSFDLVDKKLLEKPTTNIASALVGTVNGLQSWTDINGDPRFEVRGQTRLVPNGSAPLVVVDGFAIEGDLQSVNPNDIESITVLKDAAAASIWGARSANGVIVITTKKGINRKGTNVEVSSFVKFGPKTDLEYARSLASSAETIEYEKLTFNRWGGSFVANGLNMTSFSPGLVAQNECYLGYITEKQRDALLEDYKKLNNSQQIKDYLLQSPLTHQENVTISGRNDRMNNVLSLMYEDENFNMKGDNNRKVMVNYRTNVNFFRWLDFNFSGTYINDTRSSAGVSIPKIAPYEMLVNPDGTRTNIAKDYYYPNLERNVPMKRFPYSDWSYNPITEMENTDISTRTIQTRLQGGLTLKLLEGVTFDSKFQFEQQEVQNRSLYKEQSYYVRKTVNEASAWDGTMNGTITPNLPLGGILSQSRTRIDVWYLRNQLNINRTFADKHSITFLAGMEISDRVTRGYNYAPTYGYSDEKMTVGTFPNGPGGTGALTIKNWRGSSTTFPYTNSFTYRTNRFVSFYGNAAYTFDEKYTVSGSARTDASNLITDDPAYRYSPFWSIGAGWQLHKEEFMDACSWIDRMNLRATYGVNGNVSTTTSPRPLIRLDASTNVFTHDYTAQISSYGNPTLRWERTGTLNLGVDFSFWKGKLSGKVEYYDKRSKDLIAEVSIPTFNGTDLQSFNVGALSDKGMEIELGTRQQFGPVIWRGNVNVSYNQNKITKLFIASYRGYVLVGLSGPSNEAGTYVEGKNTQTLWAYRYAGIHNDGTATNPNWQPKIHGVGDALYGFNTHAPGEGRDFCRDMGTKVAPWVVGMTHSFTYKDLTLSFILTGKFGHKFFRQSFNYPAAAGDRVLPNNKLSEVMKADPMKMIPLPQNGDAEPLYFRWNWFYPYMDYLVEDASHVRIQEIALNYSLAPKYLSKIGFDRLQLYAQLNNVASFYANKFNEDPEFPAGGLKPQMNCTLGVKFQF